MSLYLQTLAARALGRRPAIRPPRRPRLLPPDGALPGEAVPAVARTPPPAVTVPSTESRYIDAISERTQVLAPGSAGPVPTPETPELRTPEVPLPLKMPGREDVPADLAPASPGQTQWTGVPAAGRHHTKQIIASVTPLQPPRIEAAEATPHRLMSREIVSRNGKVRPTIGPAAPPNWHPAEPGQPRHDAVPAPEGAPATYIHIGRVELHAALPAVTVRSAESRPAHQHMSLDEYLRRRDGRPQ
ncbi:MAG: hypothetical protein ACREC0_05435 [Methylocella sp.]